MLRFRLIESYNPYLVCIRRTECWMYEQIVSTLFSSSWHTISQFFALNPFNPMGIGLSNCLWGIWCPPKEKHLYLILKAILWVQKAKTFKIYVCRCDCPNETTYGKKEFILGGQKSQYPFEPPKKPTFFKISNFMRYVQKVGFWLIGGPHIYKSGRVALNFFVKNCLAPLPVNIYRVII